MSSAPNRADEVAERAARIWNSARPAKEGHPYLVAKQAEPLALRMDASRRLVVPLEDLDGRIRSVEFIAPDGAKRLFCTEGPDAVAALVAGAVRIPPPPPTYSAPVLTPDEARASLLEAIASFMAAIPDSCAAVDAAQEEASNADTDPEALDFNIVARAALPPLPGLPVDVGLGKISSARAAIVGLIVAGGLGKRKIVYAAPHPTPPTTIPTSSCASAPRMTSWVLESTGLGVYVFGAATVATFLRPRAAERVRREYRQCRRSAGELALAEGAVGDSFRRLT